MKESAGAAVVLFQEMDINHDGFIEPSEMIESATQDAQALRVSMSTEQAQTLIASRFRQMDIDGDGKISLAEMLAVQQAIFDAADTNGDGYVSKSELRALAVSSALKAGR